MSRCCPGGLLFGLLVLITLGAAVVSGVAWASAQESSTVALANTQGTDSQGTDDHADGDKDAAHQDDAHSEESDEKKADGDHADDEHGGSGGGDGHGDDAHGDSHGGGHGHDDTDLTHANADPQLESVLELRADLAIYTFLVFALLMLILGKFAWGPITEGLDKREKSIQAMIDDAKENSERASAQLASYEAKLAAAAEETRELLAKAHRDAEAAGQRIIADAEETAQRQKERAVADINTARNLALTEVAQKGAEIAVDLAGQIVKRELRPEDHSQLIKDSLERFPSDN